MMETLELFVKLFRGRGDARGSWSGPAIREPVTVEHFRQHLSSADESDWFGSYNVIGTQCSWGCVDIDTDDLPLARNVQNSLAVKGITSWIEMTTRGYHVWVFPAAMLVDAGIMRRALTAACTAVGYTPKEVFPKQTKVGTGGLGNFVRLPYNGYWSEGEHVPRMFVGHVNYLHEYPGDPLNALLSHMHVTRAPTTALEALAALTPTPQRVDIAVDVQVDTHVETVIAKLKGLPYTIWRDGPLPGEDRSDAMVHLARLMAEQDMPPQEAFEVLRSADLRWGKRFLERGEQGVEIMRRILAKAYG